MQLGRNAQIHDITIKWEKKTKRKGNKNYLYSRDHKSRMNHTLKKSLMWIIKVATNFPPRNKNKTTQHKITFSHIKFEYSISRSRASISFVCTQQKLIYEFIAVFKIIIIILLLSTTKHIFFYLSFLFVRFYFHTLHSTDIRN
jgi:hypothetical protein